MSVLLTCYILLAQKMYLNRYLINAAYWKIQLNIPTNLLIAWFFGIISTFALYYIFNPIFNLFKIHLDRKDYPGSKQNLDQMTFFHEMKVLSANLSTLAFAGSDILRDLFLSTYKASQNFDDRVLKEKVFCSDYANFKVNSMVYWECSKKAVLLKAFWPFCHH